MDDLPCRHQRITATTFDIVPGLLVVLVCVIVATAVKAWVAPIAPAFMALVIGATLGNAGFVPPSSRPGLTRTARCALQVGVVLLGFQLAARDLVNLGWKPIVVVVIVVVSTFVGTRWLGGRLGLGHELSLLVATGFAVCGVSAVAAMRDVTDAHEDDVAAAVALVTLFGSASIVILPLLAAPLGLDGASFGSWAGASVHDVAQVVAVASTAGASALNVAVLVKFCRIVLLAPLVMLVAMARRRDGRHNARGRRILVPPFMMAFIAAAVLRSTGVTPEAWARPTKAASTLLLTVGLAAIGTGTHFARLRAIGARPMLLGLVSWALVAGMAYLGVVVVVAH